MRQLANQPRQTGRTTILVNMMIDEMSTHEDTVYVVAGRFCIANEIKQMVRKLNGDSGRVVPLSIQSLPTYLRGRNPDPRNFFFEHTAYEMATSQELNMIYTIEDAKDAYIWMDRV